MEESADPLLTDDEALIQTVKRRYTENVKTKHFYTQLAIVDEGEQRGIEIPQLKKDASAEHKPDIPERLLPSYEEMYGPKKTIQNTDIFDATKTQRVLVVGRAGIGKTTFCEHLAHQWATGKLWADEFALVVLIPLRKLTDATVYSSKKECTLENIIYEECLSSDKTINGKRVKPKHIKKLLKKFSGKILYLLDGLDEVSAFLDNIVTTEAHTKPAQNPLTEIELAQIQLAKAAQIKAQLLENAQRNLIKELLDHKHFILTSRPYGVEGRFTHLSLRKLENIGFSDDNIKRFIESYFDKHTPGPLAKTLTEGLKTFIENNPHIRGIAHIPINLQFICSFWQNHSRQVNSVADASFSMTDLYLHIVNDSCIEALRKKGQAPEDSRWVFETPAFRGVMAFLSHLAFTRMDRKELIIPSDDIKLLQRGYASAPGLFNNVLALGLLKSTGEVATEYKDRENYYFVHLTFQEFFAAWHIAQKIKIRDTTIYTFIRDNKYDPRYEIMWWFVAGILKNLGSTPDLEIFFGILESPPRDLLQSYHTTLVMRCMDECRLQVIPERKTRFIRDFIGFVLTEHDIDILRANIYQKRAAHFIYRIQQYLKLCPTLFSEPEIIERIIQLMTHYNLAEEKYTPCRIIDLLNDQPYLPPALCARIAKLIVEIKDKEDSPLLWKVSSFSSTWSFSSSSGSSLLSKNSAILTPDVVRFVLDRKPHSRSVIPLRTLAFIPAPLPQTFLDEMDKALENGKDSEKNEAILFFTYLPGEPREKTVFAIISLLHAIESGSSFSSFEEKTNDLAASFFEKKSIPVTDAVIRALTQLFPEGTTRTAVEDYLKKYPNPDALRMIVRLTKFFRPRTPSKSSSGLIMGGIAYWHESNDDDARKAKHYIDATERNSDMSQEQFDESVALLFCTSASAITLTTLNYFIKNENPPCYAIAKIIADLAWSENDQLIKKVSEFFQKHFQILPPEIAEYILNKLATPQPSRETGFSLWNSNKRKHTLGKTTVIGILKNYCTPTSRAIIKKLFLEDDREVSQAALEYFEANPNTLENIDEIKAKLTPQESFSFSFGRTRDNVSDAIRFLQHQRSYHTEDVVTQIKNILLTTDSVIRLKSVSQFLEMVNQVEQSRYEHDQLRAQYKAARDFFEANPHLLEDRTELTAKVITALAHPRFPEDISFLYSDIACTLAYFEQNPDQLSDEIANEIGELLFSHSRVSATEDSSSESLLSHKPHDNPPENVKDFFLNRSIHRASLSDIQMIIYEGDQYKFNEILRRRQSTTAFVMFFSTRASAQAQETDEAIVKWLYSDDPFLVEGAIYYFAQKTTLLPEKIVGGIIEHLFHSTGFVRQAAIRFFVNNYRYVDDEIIRKIARLITLSSNEEYDGHVHAAALHFFVEHPIARNIKTIKSMRGFLWKRNRHKKYLAIYFFASSSKVKPAITRRIKKILLTEQHYYIINACLLFISKHSGAYGNELTSLLVSHLTAPSQAQESEYDEDKELTLNGSFALLQEHRPHVLVEEMRLLFIRQFYAETLSSTDRGLMDSFSQRDSLYVTSFDQWRTENIRRFLRQQKKLPNSVFQTFGELLYTILHEKDAEAFTSNEKLCLDALDTILSERSLAEIVAAIGERDQTALLLYFVYLVAMRLWNLDVGVIQQGRLIKLGGAHPISFDTEEEATEFAHALHALFSKGQPKFLVHSEENFWDDPSRNLPHPSIESPDFFKDYEINDAFWIGQPLPFVDVAYPGAPKFFEEQSEVCRNTQLLNALRSIGQANPSQRKPKIFIHYARKLEADDERNMKNSGLNEQWTDCFAIRLAEHLNLIGFEVILDFTSSRGGNSMYDNMRKFVYKADHVLMLYTKTYAYKFIHWWIPSIKVELSLIKERVRKESFLSTTQRRFTIPLICTEATVEGGFPYFDGTGGNVADFFTEGYIETLRKIAHNIFGVPIKPHIAKYSASDLLSSCGINTSASRLPSTSPQTTPSTQNNNNLPAPH